MLKPFLYFLRVLVILMAVLVLCFVAAFVVVPHAADLIENGLPFEKTDPADYGNFNDYTTAHMLADVFPPAEMIEAQNLTCLSYEYRFEHSPSTFPRYFLRAVFRFPGKGDFEQETERLSALSGRTVTAGGKTLIDLDGRTADTMRIILKFQYRYEVLDPLHIAIADPVLQTITYIDILASYKSDNFDRRLLETIYEALPLAGGAWAE